MKRNSSKNSSKTTVYNPETGLFTIVEKLSYDVQPNFSDTNSLIFRHETEESIFSISCVKDDDGNHAYHVENTRKIRIDYPDSYIAIKLLKSILADMVADTEEKIDLPECYLD